MNHATVAPTRESSISGRTLAGSFGWDDIDTTTRLITHGSTQLDVARCTLGSEPAALFATVRSKNGLDPLDGAALYAYHTKIDWGLIADDEGVTIFNAHWLFEENWFRLPRIRWDEISSNTDVISSLTPMGLRSGEIERIASRRYEPSSFLKPVDDELVARLDDWRDEALRYAQDTHRVDERLQNLYAQFFVLRTIEDRKLQPEVPPLTSVVDSRGLDLQAWGRLFQSAARRVGSDLFDVDVVPGIPEHVVAGVIADLYRPRGLPGQLVRYDFSWIEADVLGLAYEKYLATVLQPAPVLPQVEMFFMPQREVERVTVRKQSGALLHSSIY